MRVLAMVVALAAGAAAAQEDPAFGRWLTEGAKAAVEIARCGARACGRIVWLADPMGPTGEPLRDRRNPDPALRDRAICGMALLGGFEREGPGRWSGGTIYSAENGKTYSANMTAEDDRLRLRGYVGLPVFGETQVWTRDAGAARC